MPVIVAITFGALVMTLHMQRKHFSEEPQSTLGFCFFFSRMVCFVLLRTERPQALWGAAQHLPRHCSAFCSGEAEKHKYPTNIQIERDPRCLCRSAAGQGPSCGVSGFGQAGPAWVLSHPPEITWKSTRGSGFPWAVGRRSWQHCAGLAVDRGTPAGQEGGGRAGFASPEPTRAVVLPAAG